MFVVRHNGGGEAFSLHPHTDHQLDLEILHMDTLIRSAEKHISMEVEHYFTDTATYRSLSQQRDSLLMNERVIISDAVPNGSRKRRRRSTLDYLIEGDESFSTRTTSLSSSQLESQPVALLKCRTSILSCIPCRVLTKYCVMWAETVATVVPSTPILKKTRRTPRMTEVSIVFHSLHLVAHDVGSHPRPASYALQSICRPDMPMELECYPRHMIHFGLLVYALRRATDEEMSIVKMLPSCGELRQTSTEEDQDGDIFSCLPVIARRLLPHDEKDAVLVLGLGGNVLGQCLDHVLPPAVPIDVVEIEPAVLEACSRNKQAPTCAAEVAAAWVKRPTNTLAAAVRRCGGDAELLRYRFFLQDAASFLQPPNHLSQSVARSSRDEPTAQGMENAPGEALYGLIFLDCYDPDRETMMHDGGLLKRCRARLRPGGVLLINAHVLPTSEGLESAILKHAGGSFASVQALRVCGCDQSIVACCVANNATTPDEDAADRRFTVGTAQRMANLLNCARAERNNDPGFMIDGKWMKSSRTLRCSSKIHHRNGDPRTSKATQTTVRVWEHHA